MALTCPICGIAINDGIEICPKCHARIMPPVEKASKRPPAGVPPTIHAIEQSAAQAREQKKAPGQASAKQAGPVQVPPAPGQRKAAPPPESTAPPTVRPDVRQTPLDTPQPPRQAPGPGTGSSGTQVAGQEDGGASEPDREKTVPEPDPSGKGFPPGGAYPGWPYSHPFGFYMPFQGGPYSSHRGFEQGGVPGDTFTMGAQQLLPVPGYNMVPPLFPFLPGWPYPQFMVMPAACYPFSGMYPQNYGHCYPGFGPQYPPTQSPPRQQYSSAHEAPRKRRVGAGVIALIVILVLAVIGGGALGVYYLVKPGNPDIDLGSASVPGENIEMKNLTLVQKEGAAVLSGTYENQGTRQGEVIISVNGTSEGTEQVLSYNVPIKAETTENFSVSQSTQIKFSNASLGSILFRRSSSSTYDNNGGDGNDNSGTYPWEEDSTGDSQYDDSNGTTPQNSSDSQNNTDGTDETDKAPWEQ
ncbi:MAG: hypothetical protein JXA49_09060 [Actinobacteria bacterium]|nr:hypothetical protein [Actinomycetota bacterium]